MKEYEKKLMEQYCVEVNGLRKTRGGFLCDTKQGLLLLKELSSSEKKIDYMRFICEQLKENDFQAVDIIIPDSEGNNICGRREFGNFVLKKWFHGKECDIAREREIIESTKTLASLHKVLNEVSYQIVMQQKDLLVDKRWEDYCAGNLIENLERHNMELKKVRRYIRKRVEKGEFEFTYLKYFSSMYHYADSVVQRLCESGYLELYENAKNNYHISHGDYNYHNVMNVGQYMAVTNFEHFQIDIQVTDLYYFIRKIMEKKNWDVELGRKMLESYEEVKVLTNKEKEYIALRMAYPEKFWKITNFYYNSNKAWISEKNIEKLKISIQQQEKKYQFINEIFSFHFDEASI